MHRITMRNPQKDHLPVGLQVSIAISFMHGRIKSSRHLCLMALHSMFRFESLFGCFPDLNLALSRIKVHPRYCHLAKDSWKVSGAALCKKKGRRNHAHIVVAFTDVERMPIYSSYIGPVISFRKVTHLLII